ncbi:MAG TPA: GNAT family N-acetyltransferase [Anaerolineae bacterium]|nr:GNAT family N-acetyltransferase [Anaerolineae bacterium]
MAEQNEIPESQCIISGEGAESILATMSKWDEVSEICFAVARQDRRLVGVIGCEFDEELGRGWLWGPFALAEPWDETAAALLEELLALLPPAIRRLDFFVNEANQRAYRFYLAHGFGTPSFSHVYAAPRPQEPLVLSEPCSPLQPAQAGSFRALHDAIFPNTYYTGQDILDQRDGEHQVFVRPQGDEVVGYAYAIVDESGEGYVEFLGVHPDRRGRGLGKGLLLTALDWLFRTKDVCEVGLTVSDDQTNARSLYEKVGFRIKYTGLSARMDREP